MNIKSKNDVKNIGFRLNCPAIRHPLFGSLITSEASPLLYINFEDAHI